VHAARVASRRLRELLPVLGADAKATRRLGRRLRKVTSRLGSVRELDVLLLMTEELHESGRFAGAALDRVAERISRERSRARRRIGRHSAVEELERIAHKLARIADELDVKEAEATLRGERAWQWAVQARVAKRATLLLTSVRAAGSLYLPDRLHAVRLGVKKLRYALELSAEIDGAGRDPDLRTLKRAQDLLGRMHDLQMLIDRVREVQASVAASDLGTWRHLDSVIGMLENSCRRLHGRYVRERAALEALCERLAPTRNALVGAAAARRQAG